MGYLEIPNSWTCKLSLQIADTKKPHQSEAYAAITPLSPHEHNYQRRAINIKFSPKLSRTKHYVNLKFSGDKYWHSNKKKYHFNRTLTDIAGMINSSLYIFNAFTLSGVPALRLTGSFCVNSTDSQNLLRSEPPHLFIRLFFQQKSPTEAGLTATKVL